MTVMVSMLRRHGATIVERHGRHVAAHYGSAAAEAAVCRSRVGLAERSDRATLEVRGSPRPSTRRSPRSGASGIARGRRGGRPAARSSAARARTRTAPSRRCSRPTPASILDVSAEYAAVSLVGPLAADVMRAAPSTEARIRRRLREGDATVELLVARGYGPALWNRLLEAGTPFGIACVGLDALEHLAVSDHVDDRRRASGTIVP